MLPFPPAAPLAASFMPTAFMPAPAYPFMMMGSALPGGIPAYGPATAFVVVPEADAAAATSAQAVAGGYFTPAGEWIPLPVPAGTSPQPDASSHATTADEARSPGSELQDAQVIALAAAAAAAAAAGVPFPVPMPFPVAGGPGVMPLPGMQFAPVPAFPGAPLLPGMQLAVPPPLPFGVSPSEHIAAPASAAAHHNHHPRGHNHGHVYPGPGKPYVASKKVTTPATGIVVDGSAPAPAVKGAAPTRILARPSATAAAAAHAVAAGDAASVAAGASAATAEQPAALSADGAAAAAE